MKNSIGSIKYIFTLLLTFFLTNANGQFSTATLTENAVSGLTAVTRGQLGNDILDFNGDTYAVSVWGDASSSAGIAWEVNYSTTPYASSTSLTNTSFIFYPDVCLVTDGQDVYAIVVYWEGGISNTYYWESYIWANSGGWGFQPYSSTTFASASFTTSLHIDGNDIGEFLIIWDDGSNKINVLTGDLSAGPTITGGQLDISSTGNPAAYPDASLYHDISNDIVHVTFVDGGAGELYVEDHQYANLVSGISSGSTVLSGVYPNVLSFYYPRIACPNSGGGVGEWLVVVEDNDMFTTFEIWGFNPNSGAHIYNDGSAGGFSDDLTPYPNYRPVVTCDDQGYFWVGWMFDNTGGSITGNAVDAFYPIVLSCDLQGNIAGTAYWNVPTSLSSLDQFDFLALAGRYGSDKLYLTYSYATGSNLMTKLIDPLSAAVASAHLRKSNGVLTNPSATDSYSTFLNEQAKLNYNLKLTDLTGREILRQNGSATKIKSMLKMLSEKIVGGIYVLQIMSDDGSIFFCKKISVYQN